MIIGNHRPFTSTLQVFIIILISVLLNLVFSWFNNIVVQSPLFLDSIFTIASAMILGPVAGITVGAFTNLGKEIVYGFTGFYWPFALCNMFTGLVIGIMSRQGYFYKSINLLLSILIITTGNAILGSFITYFVYGGFTDVPIDLITDALTDMGISLFTASFWARIPTNLIDKMLSVYLAFILYFLYSKKIGKPFMITA